jgi:hypothetical protein
VIVLKPDAASMASLFCVVVCVVAQPMLNTVQVAATPVNKIDLNSLINFNLIDAKCF